MMLRPGKLIICGMLTISLLAAFAADDPVRGVYAEDSPVPAADSEAGQKMRRRNTSVMQRHIRRRRISVIQQEIRSRRNLVTQLYIRRRRLPVMRRQT